MSPAQQSARERLFDGLRQRRALQTASGIARRSQMVAWLKRLLPVAALFLLVLLALVAIRGPYRAGWIKPMQRSGAEQPEAPP